MERLQKIGKVAPKSGLQVKNSRLGLGFEKLDRNVFDPNKAYDKVGALGVKWIRLQSGWQRTERQKGVYDFTWLDEIVDNLLARGLRPWLCLCYGNDLYTERAKTVFGAVGCPPIFTEEEKAAWSAYVRATVTHFAGRIFEYEIWNEPDGQWCWKHGVNATELGIFTRDTAKLIKECDPTLQVYGGVVCRRVIDFLNEAFQTGMGNYLDAITYHEYTADEGDVWEKVTAFRALVQRYNPNLRIIQGESGSQSRSDGAGGLRGGAWTPRKQAKQLLRHLLADLANDVEFTSYFSCMDMVEALNGTVGDVASYTDYGYFGVLSASFDENGFATGEYTPKPSYYALQNLASVFAENFDVCDLPLLYTPEYSQRLFRYNEAYRNLHGCGFRRENGSYAFAYWMPTDLMTTDYESNISFQCAGVPKDIRLIDPYDSSIYRLPADMATWDDFGCVTIHQLPIKDYPMILTFGEFYQPLA